MENHRTVRITDVKMPKLSGLERVLNLRAAQNLSQRRSQLGSTDPLG